MCFVKRVQEVRCCFYIGHDGERIVNISSTDIFEFINEICNLEIANGEILVSYDVSSLFTNVPLAETIQLLAKSFRKQLV